MTPTTAPPTTRPFTFREYERTTQRVMETWRLVTLRDLSNGWGTIPAGTRVRITYKRSGLSIESERCAGCGVRMHMSRVNPSDLAIVVDADA